MPIFEYACRNCSHQFEALVRDARTPACPGCGGFDLERQLSLFAVNSEATRQASLKSVRRDSAPEHRDQMIAAQDEIDEHYGH
jgi:putative FmdB family regulatory protein